jgi:hypothetical protein
MAAAPATFVHKNTGTHAHVEDNIPVEYGFNFSDDDECFGYFGNISEGGEDDDASATPATFVATNAHTQAADDDAIPEGYGYQTRT